MAINGIVHEPGHEQGGEHGRRDADAKLTQLKKDKAAMESQLADLKKDAEDNAKMLRDQMTKLQADLKTARLEADRNAKNAAVYKAKLDKIAEGDQAAADVMVQQLADLQQKLKKEQATRQKLEDDLDQLRKQSTPAPPPLARQHFHACTSTSLR